ncbi:MAG TPA: DUF692 family protein, partial [Ilumatobacteraceae bacterium]|nr:DUF692 family protein [Ilumatobacteraceae bacterium]
APVVLDAAGELVELLEVIPERLWYDFGPGSDHRFVDVPGGVDELKLHADGRRLSAHGIGLSLPSDMPLDVALVERLQQLRDDVQFEWYSEHLSSFATMRGSVPNAQAALGLPVPYDEVVLDLVVEKVETVQSALDLAVALENPAVFTPVPYCEMTEVEFMSRLDEATSGGVLVDLHNLYTNERNGGTPAREWLEALPVSAPVEVHLAGGSELFGFYTDSHANPTPQPVWDLADEYVHRWPNVRAVVFEMHESSIDRVGVDAVLDQLHRMHDLVGSLAGMRVG